MPVVAVLATAYCGSEPTLAEDLYPAFARYVEDDPVPPKPRPADPPRNRLPSEPVEHNGDAETDHAGAAPEPLPLPLSPPRNALPESTVPPRNKLPTSAGPGSAVGIPNGSASPPARPVMERPESELPRNPLPDRRDVNPTELPSAEAAEVSDIGPVTNHPLPEYAGIGYLVERQPPPVILPQDLSLLTLTEIFCCRPAPPLVLPISGGIVHAPSGPHHWSADACRLAELGGACTGAGTVGASWCPSWRAHAGGLVLARDRSSVGASGSQRRLSFSTAAPGGTLLDTGDADWGTAGGVELGLMRRLATGRGLEIKYWGLYPDDESAAAVDPTPPGGALPDLMTTLDVSTLDFDNGVVVQSVDAFYNGAARHQLTRTFAFDNLELNVHVPVCGRCDSARTGWLGGVRYFDLDEAFAFWTDPFNTTWGDDPANELAYEIDVENRLLGVQLGVFFEYPYSPMVHFTGTAKAGAYNNDVKYQTRVGNVVTPAVVGGGPFAGQPFELTSRSDDVAFLGEAEMGLALDLSWQWRLAVGYKSVVLAGVALASDQIAVNFNNLRQSAAIDDGGTLFMHGGYARLERDW